MNADDTTTVPPWLEELLLDKIRAAIDLAASAAVWTEPTVGDIREVMQCLRQLAHTAESALGTATIIAQQKGMTQADIDRWADEGAHS